MNGKSLSNHIRLLQVILAPQVSEKATFVGEKYNQVIFRVVKDATKPEIKAAVELLWRDQKIEVAKVRTLNVKGKKRRFGKFMGKRNNWKKAFVSVKNGMDINFTELSKGDVK